MIPCRMNNIKNNVLLFISDDLRTQLGAYEGPDSPGGTVQKMYTPTTQSLLLKRGYIQITPCSPRRSSMLTSRRPHNTRVYNNAPNFRKVGGYFTILPQYFKQHCYTTVGLGKVFHPSSSPEEHETWSKPFFRGTKTFEDKKHSWNAIPDHLVKRQRPLNDQQLADRTVKTLRTLEPQAVSGTQPFYIATGFYKPHLSLVFSESFLGHDRDVELPSNSYAPREMPTIGWSPYMELNSYADIKKLRVSSAMNATFADKVALV
ncbi:iduronate 2-sulfatase-like [Dreissena polymorpha]|uniref:Sulfatase N-terminal domain-containing protein n=1 Tax=Dreissena polymorpha TaxID=45954 RepID=A0A9D3YCY2_DREPO|nr:iduronate 2-sulfatase-like [Dreissena polymorpha]KAH3698045.1 hypothetical protein DPMN_085560 [Dreissena polymorpha]